MFRCFKKILYASVIALVLLGLIMIKNPLFLVVIAIILGAIVIIWGASVIAPVLRDSRRPYFFKIILYAIVIILGASVIVGVLSLLGLMIKNPFFLV
ncbi:hypothetical protein ACQKAL_00585 [Helicobacter pylori]